MKISTELKLQSVTYIQLKKITGFDISGYVGGSPGGSSGSSVEYLCMPGNPHLGSTSNKVQTEEAAKLYGAEYESDIFAPNAKDQDAPCAVCQTYSYSNSLMIPARESCFSGLTEAYHGLLASGRRLQGDAYAGSTFVCVHESPDFVKGGFFNDIGVHLYPVVAHCGTLPCPPYKEGVLVPCVVCLL